MQMQFTPEQRDLIYAGRKTVHRIPAIGECRYREGRAYRVRVLDDEKPMMVTVIAPVAKQRLADLQARDALREGAKHVRDFLSTFAELYGEANLDREVFVIEIGPGDLRDVPRFLASGGPAPICKAIDRRDGKVCNRAFAAEQDRCKCGAKRPPEATSDHGYTTSHVRAIDEAEAVPAETQKAITARAHENHELHRADTREELLERISELRRDLRHVEGIEARTRAAKRLRSIEHHLRALQDEAMGVGSA